MKKLKTDTLDRLSQLPDALLLEILSFLQMRDVVRTTLLSKRWKYLWTTVPCLEFIECGRNTVEIRNFVSRALTLWNGSYLRKFSIFFDSGFVVVEEPSLSIDIDLWVLFAKERKVEELSIFLCMPGPFYCPPQCLYECSSIRKLLLCGCDLKIRGNVHWDHLNRLKLSTCVFSEDVINQVFSSSPQLETFKLECCLGFQNFNIRSSSMKKLSIFSSDDDESYVLTIWAPNLEALKISEKLCSTYVLTDVSSLSEVCLDFEGNVSAVVGEALHQILPAIQHVEAVKLSVSCFKMLGDSKGKYSFSPLLNVKILRIDSGLLELSKLAGLLEIFPKLKMLNIDCKVDAVRSDIGEPSEFQAENYTESETNIFNSNLLQLRTVEITWYVFKASFFDFIEFLLIHATKVEKIVMRKGRYVDDVDDMLECEVVAKDDRFELEVVGADDLVECEVVESKDLFISEVNGEGVFESKGDGMEDEYDSEDDATEDVYDSEVDDSENMSSQIVASLQRAFPSVELVLC